jgi:hypothetical protein
MMMMMMMMMMIYLLIYGLCKHVTSSDCLAFSGFSRSLFGMILRVFGRKTQKAPARKTGLSAEI